LRRLLRRALAIGLTLCAGLATASSTYPPTQPARATLDNTIRLPLILRNALAPGAEWSQLAHDPQRTGFFPAEVPQPWRLKWIWNGPAGGGDVGPAGGHLALPQNAQPIAGGGRLYIGHRDGSVRAIDQATGAVVWTAALGGEVVNAGAYDALTGSVYFASTNGQMTQLRAMDGQVLHQFNLGAAVRMAPLLAGDTVYIGAINGTLYGLDAATLNQRWAYAAGAALIASPAYSSHYGGLVIVLAEDKSVHAVQAATGARRWRVTVNAAQDPLRGRTSFADTYPVVSEANDSVIVRSYFDWNLTWQPAGGAPATVDEIRSFLAANPAYQSFFVLDLNSGLARYVAPVMGGAIGNGGDYQSVPPQVTLRRLPGGGEVAYLLWRTRQACLHTCDGREDTTVGEMDLATGNIRFVQDYKNQGTMRLPTDEQSPLSMAGSQLFYTHWMLLGGLAITDRSAARGSAYSNPILTRELTPGLNTLAAGTCANRNSSQHTCPQAMYPPNDTWAVDPGFYAYYDSQAAYNLFWSPPVRSAVISQGSLYWRTVDGAIFALQGSVP
jgi:hypothetical protein